MKDAKLDEKIKKIEESLNKERHPLPRTVEEEEKGREKEVKERMPQRKKPKLRSDLEKILVFFLFLFLLKILAMVF